MNSENLILPDYLFEVSWEVCNKVGGIHTVIATKSLNLSKELKDRHILIGPDVWMDTRQNPEFIEDNILFRTWRVSAADEGLRIRVGRWNVAGNPVAILVDFSQFISKKDEILTEFWKTFQLDSLSGQWDYIESALFGYAAGKVIESFIKFNLLPHHKVVTQFHEWMTGAGLLYLKNKKLPVATVFTTHATVVGRCLACNNVQLYDSMDLFNADEKAREFNVLAKHSLEKCAAHNADIFTTVSEITSKECSHFLGRNVDYITPNGFENTFTPDEADFPAREAAAREKLIEIASIAAGETFENPLLIGIGGRYEYRNKGIDVFIDALNKIDKSEYNGRTIIAYLMIPAGNNGPNKDLIAKFSNPASDYKTPLTHYLQDPESDQILCRLKSLGLDKNVGEKLKIIYVPTYLNGNDGVFNMTYYDLLVGLDLSVFPSYYEPWGYTPLESLAFKVPTVTTSLAGFGLWVESHYKKAHPSIEVIKRDDSNHDTVVNEVFMKILEISALSPEKRKDYKENAKDVSEIALWKNNIKYYKEAYTAAIDKIIEERGAFPEYVEEQPVSFKKFEINKPAWNRVLVTRHIPERLRYLDVISKNLWW